MKKGMLFLLVASLVVVGLGECARAAINFTTGYWETTYDCDCDGNPANGDTDWMQYSDPLVCDGLGKAGGWTAPTCGYYEHIYAAANYVGGGGGKGQRHWLCNTGAISGCNSGGTNVVVPSGETEVWLRWYMCFENGFPGDFYQFKVLYIYDSNTDSCNPLMGYPGLAGLNLYTGFGDLTHYSCSDCGWGYSFYPTGTSDGSWHYHEVHFKLESGGDDGIFQWWVDGDLKIDRSDVTYGMVDFNTLRIGSNHKDHNGLGTGCRAVDYDDIAVALPSYTGFVKDTAGNNMIGPLNTTPPVRSNGQPSGTLSAGTQTNISLTTNVQAICRYSDNSNTNYTDMPFNFTYTNSTNHSALVSDLENGKSYTFYVRCNSSDGYVNDNDFNITFSVDGHKADINDDGVIDMPEFMAFIARWKSDDGVSGAEVEQARGI
ncbi:MAG: hypothetical protein U9M95_04335 [Candidatus Altiarchaeota archaeon]|nr:hypothetical protein [Candidatus Altiarchaeota archaeon]